MDNISDQTGRGFEFAIVDELRKQAGVSLTDRAQTDQVRDGVKFRTLDQYRMRSFQRAAFCAGYHPTRRAIYVCNRAC